MKKSNQVKVKAKQFKPAPGDRAFVYQQACELDHSVEVFMNREKDLCSVTFTLDILNRKLQIVGKGKSFISASLKAKQEALQKIALVPNYNYEEKEDLVNFLKHNTFIH